MKDIVVSNSTPLILLDKIKHLHLLKELYTEIYVPEAVYCEITQSKYVNAIFTNDYIHVEKIRDAISKRLLSGRLHDGEVEVFILAYEMNAKLCLIDDLIARKHAVNLGLNITGTFGTLLNAKERGLISKVQPLLDNLIANKMRISSNIYNQILSLAKEV